MTLDYKKELSRALTFNGFYIKIRYDLQDKHK